MGGQKKNTELSFHRFPMEGSEKVSVITKLGNKEFIDRRKAWTLATKIGKPITKAMLVCSKHFQETDYFRKSTRLKRTAVPSQHLPHVSHESNLPSTSKEATSTRATRLERRNIEKEIQYTEEHEDISLSCDDCREEPSEDDIRCAEALLLFQEQCTQSSANSNKTIKKGVLTREIGVNVNTPQKLTILSLITSDESLNTFTGLNSFKMLNLIVEFIENLKIDKRCHILSMKERVILAFVKLKQKVSYAVLGVLFGISAVLCKNYVHFTLPHIAGVLVHFIHFPTKEEVMKNMPLCFEEFQDVRIVLDCTEISLQKPKCLCCRIKFYSHYKSDETIKCMIGVSPGGLITYVSEPYGGRASDKQLFEDSDIITKLECGQDAIMADKGFLIEDICDSFRIKLNRPPFLRDQKQLSVEDALINSKIASARVHIERINQRIKTFNILSGKFPLSLVPFVKCIITIACGITNLSTPILNDKRFLTS